MYIHPEMEKLRKPSGALISATSKRFSDVRLFVSFSQTNATKHFDNYKGLKIDTA